MTPSQFAEADRANLALTHRVVTLAVELAEKAKVLEARLADALQEGESYE